MSTRCDLSTPVLSHLSLGLHIQADQKLCYLFEDGLCAHA